jgi:hypothetical protein
MRCDRLLFFVGLAAFVLFWYCALTGKLPSPVNPPHAETIKNAAKSAQTKTLQDIAAESVAFYTMVLAVFTGVLAAGVLVQIWLLIKADSNARLGLEIGAQQAKISADQAEFGRLQFIATHRPKVRIKHVELSSNILDQKPITANITLISEGPTDAFLQELGIGFFIERKGKILPPVSKFQPKKIFENQRGLLKSGVSATFYNEGDGTSTAEGPAIGRRDLNLYCVGYLHYADSVGNIRTSAFCRVLEFEQISLSWVDTGRFREFKDPDYEYES